MSDRIAIEFLCVFDLPPVEFVELVGQLGCRMMSCGLQPMGGGFNLNHYPAWSLRDDASLRREMIRAMRDCGVTISLADGFAIRPDADVAALESDMALMRELGAARINTYCMEADHSRAMDQLEQLADMATAMEMGLILEFVPGLPIGSLNSALAAIDELGSDNCSLLIDTMHLVRSGSSADDLRQIRPEKIGYAQICDVPLQHPSLAYMEEALFERQVPGEGELPLLDIFSVLPAQIPVGIEVPQRALLQQGVADLDRLAPCVSATRGILETLT